MADLETKNTFGTVEIQPRGRREVMKLIEWLSAEELLNEFHLATHNADHRFSDNNFNSSWISRESNARKEILRRMDERAGKGDGKP